MSLRGLEWGDVRKEPRAEGRALLSFILQFGGRFHLTKGITGLKIRKRKTTDLSNSILVMKKQFEGGAATR